MHRKILLALAIIASGIAVDAAPGGLFGLCNEKRFFTFETLENLIKSAQKILGFVSDATMEAVMDSVEESKTHLVVKRPEDYQKFENQGSLHLRELHAYE